jgi:hypothetical protein
MFYLLDYGLASGAAILETGNLYYRYDLRNAWEK